MFDFQDIIFPLVAVSREESGPYRSTVLTMSLSLAKAARDFGRMKPVGAKWFVPAGDIIILPFDDICRFDSSVT